MGVWNEGMYIAGQRAWRASTAKGLDDATRRALERLSVSYFYGAVGIDRRGADQMIDAPRPRADTQRD